MIAGELAAAGKSVCVLEMGGYHDDRDFDQLELSAYQRLYLNGGPFPTAEGQIGLVAGTGVGGGTVDQLDQLPAHPRLGARGVGARARPRGPRPSPSSTPTWTRSGSGSASTPTAPTSPGRISACARRASKLGYDFRPITRNADPELYDPASAAFMGFGDASGSKQSTAKTYLLDAQRAGARIISDCRRRADPGRGRARRRGRGRLHRPRGRRQRRGRGTRVVVRAPVVVVACGSIESPALLLRSRIGGPAAGDYLRLHPTAAVTAFYDEPQNWCWGPPQAALSHQFADVGDGHGFLFEAAQATTGLFAGAVPWRSGARPQAA